MSIALGFDIDDVITKTSDMLLKAVEENGTGIDFNNPLTSKKEILRGRAATEEVKEFFRKYGTDACRNVELKEGADRVIQELKKMGVQIHLITARDETLMPGITQATIEYMKRKKISYDQLHIGVHDKKELCDKLEIKCLTDDSIDTCRNLVGSSIMPILFTTPVNIEFDAEGIQRVADWDELYDILLQILQKEVSKQGDGR